MMREYLIKLKKSNSISGDEMMEHLDTCQIASAHKYGEERIAALKAFVQGGKALTITDWKGVDVVIVNVDQLRGFIQCCDPRLDILDEEKFGR